MFGSCHGNQFWQYGLRTLAFQQHASCSALITFAGSSRGISCARRPNPDPRAQRLALFHAVRGQHDAARLHVLKSAR
jgi:hypothetical protein